VDKDNKDECKRISLTMKRVKRAVSIKKIKKAKTISSTLVLTT
jgi:hypothetical protein